MQILLLCVGKLKEAFFREAAGEYEKRLRRFCRFEVAEVGDEAIPMRASEAEVKKLVGREGEKLLSRLQPGDFVLTMEIGGKRYTSEGFAQALAQWVQRSRLVIVIGGSQGLSEAVLKRADARLSLSDMTLPHQLARVVLLEQVYRAFKINGNETYHK